MISEANGRIYIYLMVYVFVRIEFYAKFRYQR